MRIDLYKKIVITLCLVLVGIFGTSVVHAQVEFNPQVNIPGIKTSDVQPDGDTSAIGEYIKGIYNYGIGIVTILATAVMMFGGFRWIIAGGNAEKIGEAKAWIGAALTGLVLALGSFTILNLINPNLTSLTVTDVTPIKEIESSETGCCDWPDGSCTDNIGKVECEDGSFGGEIGTYIGPSINHKCGETKCVKCIPDGERCDKDDKKCEDCCNGYTWKIIPKAPNEKYCGE